MKEFWFGYACMRSIYAARTATADQAEVPDGSLSIQGLLEQCCGLTAVFSSVAKQAP